MLPPTFSTSKRNVVAEHALAPRSTRIEQRFYCPQDFRASATSRCCHAGNRMSLATPYDQSRVVSKRGESGDEVVRWAGTQRCWRAILVLRSLGLLLVWCFWQSKTAGSLA